MLRSLLGWTRRASPSSGTPVPVVWPEAAEPVAAAAPPRRTPSLTMELPAVPAVPEPAASAPPEPIAVPPVRASGAVRPTLGYVPVVDAEPGLRPTRPSLTAVLCVPPVDVEAEARAQLASRSATLIREFTDARIGADATELVLAIRDAGAEGIRQPPAEAQRVLAASRDASTSLADLQRLAEGSPALTQSLLRAANSAYYGNATTSCTSIPDALRRLGTTGVEGVAVSAMVEGLLCRPGSAFQPILDAVWSHMVRTAPVARAIAPAFASAPSEAFALGLLHDVGKLAILDRLSSLRSARRRELSIPYPALKAILVALHEPLGALTTHRWGLGPYAAQAIGSHHSGEPIPEAAADHLRQLLFVAERAELAMGRRAAPELETWWTAGTITAQFDRVLALLPTASEAGAEQAA